MSNDRYTPLNPISSEAIESAVKRLSEEEQAIIDRQMTLVAQGLRKKKAEQAKELEAENGKRPLPSGGKMMFGRKSNLELMSRLGALLKNLEENEPEIWKDTLKWARS